MKFADFVAVVETILEDMWDERHSDRFYIENGFLVQKHRWGGAEGGNCWGDDAHSYQNDEPMDDFIPLEKLVTQVKPDILLREYKEILSLVETNEHTEHEYYGNWNRFIIKQIKLTTLCDVLYP